MPPTLPGAEEIPFARKLADREPTAWERFMDEYAPGILGAVRKTLTRYGCPADDNEVEETGQEVILSLLVRDAAALRNFAGRARLRTWLHTVAVSRTIDRLRGRRENLSLEDVATDPVDDGASPDEPVLAGEDRLWIERGLEGLDPRQRLILQMHYGDGLPYRTIARRLNVSENSVGAILHRAREALRNRLDSPEKVPELPNQPAPAARPTGRRRKEDHATG